MFIRLPSLKFVGLSVQKIWLIFGHSLYLPAVINAVKFLHLIKFCEVME